MYDLVHALTRYTNTYMDMQYIPLHKTIKSKLQPNPGTHIDLWGVDTTQICPGMIDLWNSGYRLRMYTMCVR